MSQKKGFCLDDALQVQKAASTGCSEELPAVSKRELSPVRCCVIPYTHTHMHRRQWRTLLAPQVLGLSAKPALCVCVCVHQGLSSMPPTATSAIWLAMQYGQSMAACQAASERAMARHRTALQAHLEYRVTGQRKPRTVYFACHNSSAHYMDHSKLVCSRKSLHVPAL